MTVAQIILAAIVTAATIGLAVVAFFSFRSNGKYQQIASNAVIAMNQVSEEINNLRNNVFRPYVTLTIDWVRIVDSTVEVLTIANRGSVPAVNIKFEVLDQDDAMVKTAITRALATPQGWRQISDDLIERGMDFLAPFEKVQIPFKEPAKQIWNRPFDLTISYESPTSLGIEGNKYNETRRVNPEELRDIRLAD